jgi:hypothetical protein
MQIDFKGKKVEARRVANGEASGSNPIYIGMKKVRLLPLATRLAGPNTQAAFHSKICTV